MEQRSSTQCPKFQGDKSLAFRKFIFIVLKLKQILNLNTK